MPLAPRLTDCIELILQRLDAHQDVTLDQSTIAFRWRRPGGLAPVRVVRRLDLSDLLHIERQKATLVQNTRQHLAGLPANNALLWGSRGTGKSSLIKALLTEFADQGLRLIEVEPHDLIDLPDIVEPLWDRPERFIVFTDDLSFEANDPSYKALKAMLDGSVRDTPANVLIYATSNRRHLMPEFMRENLEAQYVEGELHHGEAVEEKVSLSDRFGLWLSFYPFSQDQYLEAVRHWLTRLGAPVTNQDEVHAEALRWALLRGSRSGRTAYQFARDLAGRLGLADQVHSEGGI